MKTNSQMLMNLFHLSRSPVGIKFIKPSELTNNESNPYKAIPYKHFQPVKHKAYYCWLVKQASQGKAFYLTPNNNACETAGWVTGLLPSHHFGNATENIEGWYRCQTYVDYRVARMIYEQMQPLSVENSENSENRENACFSALLIGALEHFDLDHPPDVVLLMGQPVSVMRMVQSYAAFHGWGSQMKTSGMCGICYEATVQPLQLNTLTLSTLCSGTRFYAKWGVHEMAGGIPYAQLHTLLEGALLTMGPCETDSVKEHLSLHLADKHKTYALRPSYFK